MPTRSMLEDPFYHILQERNIFEGVEPPSDIVMLRHGEFRLNNPVNVGDDPTEAQLEQLVRQASQANYREGLNQRGIDQARLVGGKLLELLPSIDLCACSPMKRARETAALALPGWVPVEFDGRLAERSRGEVQGVPKGLLEAYTNAINARLPEEQRHPFDKQENPLHWIPLDGEPLSLAAQWLRNALFDIAKMAPAQCVVVSTHGEVTIAARTVKELGNMDNEALKRGITPECPALEVSNGQFDWYTRRMNPEDVRSKLAPAVTHLRSVSMFSDPPIDTGFIPIADFGRH